MPNDNPLECECIEAPGVGQSGFRAYGDVWELAGGSWVDAPDYRRLATTAVASAFESRVMVVITLDLSSPASLLDRARFWLSQLDSWLKDAYAEASPLEGEAPSVGELRRRRLRERQMSP